MCAWRLVYRKNSLDEWHRLPGHVLTHHPVTGEEEIHEMHRYEDREDTEEHKERLDKNPGNNYEYSIKKVNQ